MSLNQEIIRLLKNEDCNIVGFADLRVLPEEPRKGSDCGIVIQCDKRRIMGAGRTP